MADDAVDPKPVSGTSGRRYTDRWVLALLSVLAVMLLALSLFAVLPDDMPAFAEWGSSILANVGAGIVGSCVTFFLIDLRLNRRREEEARLEAARAESARAALEDERRRVALIAEVRSQNLHNARSAIEELRLRGWLSDGSLRGVDFSAADLRSLNLSGASLVDGVFRGADLRDADFTGADLRGCDFEMADLRGWRTAQALIEGADFTGARRE